MLWVFWTREENTSKLWDIQGHNQYGWFAAFLGAPDKIHGVAWYFAGLGKDTMCESKGYRSRCWIEWEAFVKPYMEE
jgi:hypothetical protein